MRKTKETEINLTICLDGKGRNSIDTGIAFFDHMLDGFARHGLFDLEVEVKGDLEVDCHHTVEDTGIVLGQAIAKALGDKAGIKRYGSFILPMDETPVSYTHLEPEAQQEMIDLNCRALTRLTMTCLPFLTRGSRIVNLASAAAFCPQPYFAVYAATKSYVLSFSQALGAELLKDGIYVTAVCPGPVDTEFFDVSGRLPHKWKDAVMAAPTKGVHQALIDSRRKKPVSVYGMAMKAADLGAKLLPHNMIIKLESMGKD